MIRKRLSWDDNEDGISAAEVEDSKKVAKKAIPRSHLAEIIDEFEVGEDDMDDDVSEDIATDTDDAGDDR